MDISVLLKAKQAWSTFKNNHPKFPAFLADLKNRGAIEGTIVDITVKYPDGSQVKTNLAVKQSDIELIDVLKNMK